MRLLLDTNAYVDFKLNHTELVEYVTKAEKVLISPIVYGELLLGFRNGTRFEKNMAELDLFMTNEAVEMIQIGSITADRYSRIIAQLKQQGTPIPSNDIWIAAQTMESGAELVTGDNHFMSVGGLVYRFFE